MSCRSSKEATTSSAVTGVPLLNFASARLGRVPERQGLGDRGAVAEFRFGTQEEGDGALVVGEFGGIGDQSVDGVRLVSCAHHQAVEQELEPLRRIIPADERVEAVERQHRLRADG